MNAPKPTLNPITISLSLCATNPIAGKTCYKEKKIFNKHEAKVAKENMWYYFGSDITRNVL